jgi:hypothetical protein
LFTGILYYDILNLSINISTIDWTYAGPLQCGKVLKRSTIKNALCGRARKGKERK